MARQPIPSSYVARGQALAKAKYGPEIDALGQLVQTAMDTYNTTRSQANAAGRIIAAAARQAQQTSMPQFDALQASANRPGAPAPGPAMAQAIADQGITRQGLVKMFGQDQVDAMTGAQYQIGQAARA